MRKIDDKNYSVVEAEETNRKALANPQQFVEECEDYYYTQLNTVADKILASKEGSGLVLLCGPSGSGKTTTAHKLKDRLIELGTGASVISMDDFYKGIASYRVMENGQPDMEAVETIDIELLNKCISELLFKGESQFPIFDFEKQLRLEDKKTIRLGGEDIIIMEGIHALNTSILKDIPLGRVFRMYVSVRTKFVSGGEDVLRPSAIRLLRRMVRDTLFRGYPVYETVGYWDTVLEGERQYIDPYRDDVNFKMDTTIDYEVCVWHNLLHKTLAEVDIGKARDYPRMVGVMDALKRFSELPIDLIPENSLLREFIGS